nr:MAG: capsid protein precursor [Astroviridae sp.]
MESKPKPQRVRQKKKKDEKVKVEVKIEDKEKKKRKVTKQRNKEKIVVEHEGMEHQMAFQEERRKLRTLERRIKKLGKEEKGPKVNDMMTVSLTLGVIPGIDTKNLARMRKIFTNPALLKPADAEKSATPLGIRASQYDLWRPTKVSFTFKPLTGHSVVTGSLLLCDLDQDGGAAKPENIDLVKARPHVEVNIGQTRTWHVPRRFLLGPRQGWWYVDTNENPTQSLGPAFNIWLYMSTRNLFSADNSIYTGPLFLAEMDVTYQFSNYNPKPGMQDMQTLRLENPSTQNADFTTDLDGSLILRVPAGSAFAKELAVTDEPIDTHQARAEQNGALGSKIWSMASDVIETASTALGPWGWLLKGGWFLLRRIFTNSRTSEAQYYKVYASVEDARADQGIHPTLSSASVNLPQGDYFLQQITEPNVAGSPPVTTRTVLEPQPPQDYLPLAFSVDVIDDLPLIYLLNSSNHKPTRIDGKQFGGSFILAGLPEWYMYDHPQQPGTSSNMQIDFKVQVPNVGEHHLSVKGLRIVNMDFTQAGVILGCNGIGGLGVIHTPQTFLESLKVADGLGQMGEGANRMFMRPTYVEVSNGAANWVPFDYNITDPGKTRDNIYIFDLRYMGQRDALVIGIANLTTQRLNAFWIGQSQSFYPNSMMWFTNGWKPFGADGYENKFAMTLKKVSGPQRQPHNPADYLGWVEQQVPDRNRKVKLIPGTRVEEDDDGDELEVIDRITKKWTL